MRSQYFVGRDAIYAGDFVEMPVVADDGTDPRAQHDRSVLRPAISCLTGSDVS